MILFLGGLDYVRTFKRRDLTLLCDHFLRRALLLDLHVGVNIRGLLFEVS